MKKTSHITRYTQQKNKPRVTLSSKSQTPALSLGERENRPPRFRQCGAPRLVAAPDAASPLPAGEGRGEGEGYAANQNGPTNFARSTRPAPQGTKAAMLPQALLRFLDDRYRVSESLGFRPLPRLL